MIGGHKPWLFAGALAAFSCVSLDDGGRFGPALLVDEHFEVYVESGVHPSAAALLLERAKAVRRQLLGGLLRPLDPGRIPQRKILLRIFRSPASYSEFVSDMPERPVAHFSRTTMRIYLPYQAPEEALRHELAHALLESQRPGAPFWLHEGLAGMLQRNALAGNCQNPTSASLPAERLIAVREHLQALSPPGAANGYPEHFVLPTGFTCSERRPSTEDRLLAEFLMLYLWQQRRLRAFLTGTTSGAAFEPVLLDGEQCPVFARRFAGWLHSRQAARAQTGC